MKTKTPEKETEAKKKKIFEGVEGTPRLERLGKEKSRWAQNFFLEKKKIFGIRGGKEVEKKVDLVLKREALMRVAPSRPALNSRK